MEKDVINIELAFTKVMLRVTNTKIVVIAITVACHINIVLSHLMSMHLIIIESIFDL